MGHALAFARALRLMLTRTCKFIDHTTSMITDKDPRGGLFVVGLSFDQKVDLTRTGALGRCECLDLSAFDPARLL